MHSHLMCLFCGAGAHTRTHTINHSLALPVAGTHTLTEDDDKERTEEAKYATNNDSKRKKINSELTECEWWFAVDCISVVRLVVHTSRLSLFALYTY